MKWAVTTLVLIAVLAPSAYAVGQARDPRVPALQRRVAVLERQQADLAQSAYAFHQQYVLEGIDGRVFAFCQAIRNSVRAFAGKPATEPLAWYFLNEPSATYACR
jgi:hypothetical protein